MPLYQERWGYKPLSWSFVFSGPDEFEQKLTEFGSRFTEHGRLYELLVRKYIAADTRYSTEEPFILAIIRELEWAWPMYQTQSELMERLKEIEIARIMESQSSLTNVVQSHDDPVVDADKIAIPDLSNQQQVTRITGNELVAIMTKYEAIQRNFVDQLYRRLDPLFAKFISSGTHIRFYYDEEEDMED